MIHMYMYIHCICTYVVYLEAAYVHTVYVRTYVRTYTYIYTLYICIYVCLLGYVYVLDAYIQTLIS